MRTLPKVLVVDDDPVVGRSFDRVLSEKGYIVITARNGEEALNKLKSEEYDVVFTDIKMPGMDGIEVATRVKEKRPWVPVVIVTGYGTAANEAKAKEVGVSEFLHKPLSPETIEGSTRKALLEKGATAAVVKGIEAAVKPEPMAAEEERAPGDAALFAKNTALLFAAPFIALAYVVALPFIGLGALAWFGVRTFVTRFGSIARFVKNVALFFAAPFVGLAYAVAFPFIGLGMLAWWGARALMKREDAE